MPKMAMIITVFFLLSWAACLEPRTGLLLDSIAQWLHGQFRFLKKFEQYFEVLQGGLDHFISFNPEFLLGYLLKNGLCFFRIIPEFRVVRLLLFIMNQFTSMSNVKDAPLTLPGVQLDGLACLDLSSVKLILVYNLPNRRIFKSFGSQIWHNMRFLLHPLLLDFGHFIVHQTTNEIQVVVVVNFF